MLLLNYVYTSYYFNVLIIYSRNNIFFGASTICDINISLEIDSAIPC